MSTCQSIITRALQKLGIVGSGASPLAADNTLGMQALAAVLQNLLNSGAFGDLIDVIPSVTSYTPGENERIINDGSVTVTLPTQLPLYTCGNDYGVQTFTADPNYVRPPMDMSVIEVVNTSSGVVNTYLYDNRLRSWIDINALTTSSICPLASRDENGMSCKLALALASEFGQQPDELTKKAAYDFDLALAQNWSQAGELQQRKDWF